MNGLGGLNPSPNGVVLGLVQLALPLIETRADITRQTERIVAMVAKARRNMASTGSRGVPGIRPARPVDGYPR